MTVLLNRSYMGYPAGSTVELSTDAEQALIAQGLASSALAANITTGPVTANTYNGTVSVPIGSSSVVITNSNIDANSKVHAVVAQAAADATLLRVERIVCAAGLATIFGTANATAATLIDWSIVSASGLTIRN